MADMRRYVIDITPAAPDDQEDPRVLVTVLRHGEVISEQIAALIPALAHAQDSILQNLEADPL